MICNRLLTLPSYKVHVHSVKLRIALSIGLTAKLCYSEWEVVQVKVEHTTALHTLRVEKVIGGFPYRTAAVSG